jgi:hypothetical protein
MGLDRIQEVRTLRGKLSALCSRSGQAQISSSTLAKEWLEDQAPDAAGIFYTDGQVRIYHGKLTKLPRRYIARERLCLRGTTEYWVNAMDGQPFFLVTRPVDPGLLTVLRGYGSVVGPQSAGVPFIHRFFAAEALIRTL